MPRYAAFLRGINVGGHRVTSGELRSILGEIGLAEVATFRASGNVIFSAEGRERPDKIASRVEGALSESLGYAVPTFVRTEREVRAIAELEPFEAELVGASAGKLQVALLAAEPPAQVRKKALSIG